MTSCILHVTTGNEFVKIELGGRDKLFFEALQEAAMEKATLAGNPDKWRETPIEWHEWVEAYRILKPGEKGFDRSSLSKMRTAVCTSGWARKTVTGQYLAGE